MELVYTIALGAMQEGLRQMQANEAEEEEKMNLYGPAQSVINEQ